MVWITKDGKQTTPAQIETRHLLNCIRLLDAKALAFRAKIPECSKMNVQEIAKSIYLIYGAMVREIEHRMAKAKLERNAPQRLALLGIGRRKIVIDA